ncbi:hypothetical protein NDU88_006986 [Pleurodeles waltl]|uniref:Uncharacterized protein n=1 Tax=Pleurodeles waltl TaxID=8319 RepID=A0AAV7MLK7_PLEWA|nr:hypothetical protein NDU88_006986 [Pleurodeles waltl]
MFDNFSVARLSHCVTSGPRKNYQTFTARHSGAARCRLIHGPALVRGPGHTLQSDLLSKNQITVRSGRTTQAHSKNMQTNEIDSFTPLHTVEPLILSRSGDAQTVSCTVGLLVANAKGCTILHILRISGFYYNLDALDDDSLELPFRSKEVFISVT